MDQTALIFFRSLIRQLAEPTTENFTDQQIDDFLRATSKAIYKMDEYFSTPENPNTSIAYVTRGLFRLYIIDQHGNQAAHDFTGEGMFMSSYGGIVLNKVFPFHIQAIEDSEVYTMSREEFMPFWNNDARWKNILQKATELDHLEMHTREMELLLYDAQTRYTHFLEYFKKYDNRIQLRYIASYLGISPASLSRIRKTVSN